MVSSAIITEKAYLNLLELAKRYAPKIICGFLVGRREEKVVYINEVREVLTRTSPSFHFKPNWYNYSFVLSRIKEEGKKVVGEFHSHPTGSEELNFNDKKILRTLGSGFWIIVTPQKVVPWYFEHIDEFKDICERVPLQIEYKKRL